jgi:hypothetical protein
VVTWRPPTAEELRSLLFAWRVCKHVKSNAIVYARDGQTLGVGAGQMSRVDAAKFGAMKAVLPLKGCVAASDAFFPFPDGLEAGAAGRSDGGDPAGRLGARRGSDCRGRQAGRGHGLHRDHGTSGIDFGQFVVWPSRASLVSGNPAICRAFATNDR